MRDTKEWPGSREICLVSPDLNKHMLRSNKWITRMRKKHLNISDIKSKVDYGIITVREDEFQAVIRRLKHRNTVRGKSNLYEYARIKTNNNEEVGIAVVCCLHKGEAQSQGVTHAMLSELSPPWILLVGIAGGIPNNEYSLGDVLIASRFVSFSITTAIQGGVIMKSISGEYLHPDVDKVVRHLKALEKGIKGWNYKKAIKVSKPIPKISEDLNAKVYYGKPNHKKKVMESLMQNFPSGKPLRNPICCAAPAASSNTLVKDADLAESWLTSAKDVAHVEMELEGVLKAARFSGGQNCRVLMARGLSDIVGYKRTHPWTLYACNTAASFIVALIKSGVLRLADDLPTNAVAAYMEVPIKIRRRFDNCGIRAPSGTCNDRDEVYDTFVWQADAPVKEVVIAEHDTVWFWKLFPSILHWRLLGTHVIVILPRNLSPLYMAREKQRRNIMKQMGVVVVEVAKTPIPAFVFSRHDQLMSSAIIYNECVDDFSALATYYSGKTQWPAVSAIREKTLRGISITPSTTTTVRCIPGKIEPIIDALKSGVVQYSKPHVSIERMRVPLSKIDMLTKYIRGYKYRQVPMLIDTYESAGVALFSPMVMKSSSGFTSIVTPPVIETHGDRFVAIEGHTRICFCSLNGVDNIECIVVHGVHDPLPAECIDLDGVQIVYEELPPKVRMVNYRHEHFRGIEGAIRPVNR